jgi:3-dehydroquinate dehydratase-1
MTVTPVTVRGATIGGDRPVVIVPLTGADPEALHAEAAAVVAAGPDVVEWRVDHLTDLAAAGRVAADLRADLGDLPLLVTVRTLTEGGQADVTDAAYLTLLRDLLGTGTVDLLDVEITRDATTVRTLVDLAHAAGVPVIASQHDFAGTPAQDELVRRLLHMADVGADVLKIAVMPQDAGDVLALLGATWEASRRTDRPLITMAMGTVGVASRIAGGVFGSAATFAAVGRASAPGQVGIVPLRAALDLLHP